MAAAIDARLDRLLARHRELTARLADPELVLRPAEYQRLAREYAELEPIAEAAERLRSIEEEIAENEKLLADPDCDEELAQLAREELLRLRKARKEAEKALQSLLLPQDARDARDVVLEIRAGAGGEEAALFAADLLRMYARYAERRGWRFEIVSMNETGIGGVKEAIAFVRGRGAYARLKFESGVHRVQRVPVTESGGRIHTSTATVAVLPEAEELEVEIRPEDLRIDTFRAQGAGGQHVNKTESAVRITHIPTGIVVVCQDEKSQHKNKARAMKVLRARLLEKMRKEAEAERAEQRRSLIGSGDRSERIRTYNFPQRRVTDHRIGLTLHRLEEILDGDLDELIDRLAAEDRARRLAAADA